MRKIISLLILTIYIVSTGHARTPVGAWSMIPVFGDVSHIAETKDKVFYLTGGSLYHYDKEYGETRHYSPGDDLSDHNATAIYADGKKGRVAVLYDNGNIDILYPDGHRVNLPDIKIATLDEEKTVNDIVFDPDTDRLYVAASFGLVVFDLARAEVKESGIYHHPVKGLIVTPTHIVLSVPAETGVTPHYVIAKDQSIRAFKNFTPVSGVWGQPEHWYPLDDSNTRFATIVYDNQLKTGEVDADGTVRFRATDMRGRQLVPTSSDGLWLIGDDGLIYAVGADGNITRKVSAPVDALADQRVAAYSGLGSVWMADRDGIGHYRLSPEGVVTVLAEKFSPAPATSFKEICSLFPAADGVSFIAMNIGGNSNHPFGSGDNPQVRLGCDVITPGSDEVVTISPVGATAVSAPGMEAVMRKGPYIFAPTFIAESPFSPGTYYIGTSQEGIYVVRDNEIIAKWDESAGIFKIANYRYDVQYGCFDDEGNLWVATFTNSTSIPGVKVLPAAKVKKNPADITPSDWLVPNLGESLSGKDTRILHCRHSHMSFFIDSNYTGELVALDNAGTMTTFSDDRRMVWTSFLDQDGKPFPGVTLRCMAEDMNGQIWIGTQQGVFAITDPHQAVNPDMRVNRIKVPRNDGTNLADYLLDSEKISAIAVDHSNRKWIGTEKSGLFLVSPSGDEIIANYTADNSMLSTPTITSLRVDPESNNIYVGTLDGLYILASTSSPARPDYSDVYAYPNPVTPDYTGWVTVTGLMDNSLVKIMDSAMHLVAQLTSEGGMAVWDGCNLNGERVRAGVYYVLASSGDSSSSAGDVVTKILVIN